MVETLTALQTAFSGAQLAVLVAAFWRFDRRITIIETKCYLNHKED